MDIQEIIDLLEESRMAGNTHLLPNVSYYAVNPDKYNQALTLLKQQPKDEAAKFFKQTKEQQPTAGELKKDVDAFFAKMNPDTTTMPEMEENLRQIVRYLKEALKRLDRAEAINKELIKALKRYGHHDSPCAGILDLNDDSECSCGFEAAIAKANKGIKRDGTTPPP